jgi:hypothetical protein
MALADIPSRDTDDGATQLAKLRSYLKDSDSSQYRFPDIFLIMRLVQEGPVLVWRSIANAPKTAIPWSYEVTGTNERVPLIRTLIGDTEELTLRYTDYELDTYLEFLPLRYLVKTLIADVPDTATYPSDSNDPIRIMRDLLSDLEGLEYSDQSLISLMLKNKLNPYGVVVKIIEDDKGVEAVEGAKSSGGGFASIDGISFSTDIEVTPQMESEENLEIIKRHQAKSVYARNDIFQWLTEGVPNIDVSGEWYAV